MSKHLIFLFIGLIAAVPAIFAQTFDSDFRFEKKLFPDDKILPLEFTVKGNTLHKDSWADFFQTALKLRYYKAK